MTSSPDTSSAAATPATKRRPKENQAIPLRHPGRWIFASVVLVLLGIFLFDAASREAYHWDTYFKYILDTRIAVAALHTIALTILAMVLGVVLLDRRRSAHVPQPGAAGSVLAVPVDIPRHAGVRAAGVLGSTGRCLPGG